VIDVARYVGLPYRDHGRGPEAFDCWGLVRLVYLEVFKIELPSFVDGYLSASWDAEGVAALVVHERARWREVQDRREGDVVVIRMAARPRHVGLWLEGNRMLHTLAGHDSALESLESPKWARRIDGVYRYAA
jgi:cell wall-associated NlpC family hydrolase